MVLATISILPGCTQPPPDPSKQIIARVNGEPIPAREFQFVFNQLKAEQDDVSVTNTKLINDLKHRALNEVLILNLLRQEAAKKNVRIAREEVEGRLANWKDGYPPGGFEEMLRKQNTTEEFLKKRIEDQLLVEKLSESLFSSETLVSDDETKKYFKQHEREFFSPEKVHVLQIVVPTKEEADKIRQEILASTITFESAARKYSLSPDAVKGGDLGFFAKIEKIAAFNEAFGLPVGTISKPIQSRYGVHLLKMLEKQPYRRLGFNEAKLEIVKSIKKEKEVKAYKEWVGKLLKDAEIFRNESLFSTVS